MAKNIRCVVEGCENETRSKEHCAKHHSRMIRGGITTPRVRKRFDIKVPDDMRWCNVCEEIKSLSEFGFHGKNYRTECKKCANVWRQLDKAANPEKYIEKERRSSLKKIGWTLEEYNAMAYAQGGRCYVCGDPCEKLYADHDHETGERRMLTCSPCNIGLGHFKDDPDKLESAARYIRMMMDRSNGYVD